MKRSLPPLNGLRAFEAAARHMSFTDAAEELSVTQAAISHQVRGLDAMRGGQRQQALHVVARGEFRHDAAKSLVQVDLGEQLVRQQAALAVEHRGGAFVAGRFDAENFHGFES